MYYNGNSKWNINIGPAGKMNQISHTLNFLKAKTINFVDILYDSNLVIFYTIRESYDSMTRTYN